MVTKKRKQSVTVWAKDVEEGVKYLAITIDKKVALVGSCIKTQE